MLKIFFNILASLFVVSFAYAADVLILSEADMQNALLKEISAKEGEENIDIEFFGGQTSFQVKDAKTAKILISNLKLNHEANKFTADAEIFADGKSFTKTKLVGKFYSMIEVFTPVREIRKNEIIRDEMLKSELVRQSRLKAQMVTDRDKLINKQAKKPLKADKLIFARDIGKEIVINRGDIVTSIYRTKHMQITAKVEAKDDAGIGDNLEVINVKSGKILSAKVIDGNTVEVRSR